MQASKRSKLLLLIGVATFTTASAQEGFQAALYISEDASIHGMEHIHIADASSQPEPTVYVVDGVDITHADQIHAALKTIQPASQEVAQDDRDKSEHQGKNLHFPKRSQSQNQQKTWVTLPFGSSRPGLALYAFSNRAVVPSTQSQQKKYNSGYYGNAVGSDLYSRSMNAYLAYTPWILSLDGLCRKKGRGPPSISLLYS